MSVTIRMCPAYSLVCEQPGCDRRLTDEGRVIWFNPGDLELDALRADWQHDGDDRWYCPKHWQFNCQTCGRRYSRPNPHTKEGKQWVETHGRDCPDCIKKRNLAEFEKLAKKLEE